MADLANMMSLNVTVPIFTTMSTELVRHVAEHSETEVVFVGLSDSFAIIQDAIPDHVRNAT